MNFSPMLCGVASVDQVSSGLFDDGVWIAQRKCDGIRAYARGGRLFSRSGRDITEKFPEFHNFLKTTENDKNENGFVFDGEIVAETGEFNDVGGRVHLKDKLFIKVASQSNPCKFVLFDKVVPQGDMHTQRNRDATLRITIALAQYRDVENIEVADNNKLPSDLLKQAEKEGWEGIVLKKVDSLYYNGRNQDWRKVKLFKETTHSFSSYDDHPKGVLLIDGDRKVNVNGKEAQLVKQQIEQKGSVTVEIQYLPQYNSSKWRFPSYRGIVKEA